MPRLPLNHEVFLDTAYPTHFRLAAADNSFELLLKRRTSYPVTFCEQNGRNSFRLGYGNPSGDLESEFLDIRLEPEGFYIVRDAICTLPLFYACVGQKLYVGNDFAEVVQALDSATVSKAAIHNTITKSRYDGTTYVREVRVLGEREVLTWRRGKLDIQLPPARGWIESAAAPPQDPKAFRTLFIKHLQFFYATRLEDQSFACEVSGGLDSATLPQFLAQQGVRKFPISARLYGSKFRKSQTLKLEEVRDRVQGDFISEPIDEHTDFPFNSMLEGVKVPFFARNPYAEADERYYRKLRDEGIKVLVTGHGGDDIFEQVSFKRALGYGEVDRENRRTHTYPVFLTPKFAQEYIAGAPDFIRPRPLHSISRLTGQTYNNRMINHDIWPVSPFISPGLYAFCQGLPVYYRANKSIMRAFHSASGFTESIYNASELEHFGGPLLTAVKAGKYDLLIKNLLRNSVMLRLGYLNEQSFLDYYNRVKVDPSLTEDSSEPLDVQTWLGLELSLQAVKDLKIT